jgi:hypothetical protein
MGLNQVHSGSGQEGALGDPWFAGNHGPEGEFNSLKGRALEAPELSFYDQDGNQGPERLNQEVSKSDWRDYGPVQSGTFDPDSLTRGTDKHMPK